MYSKRTTLGIVVVMAVLVRVDVRKLFFTVFYHTRLTLKLLRPEPQSILTAS